MSGPTYDVIIIGSGLAGAAAAYRLALHTKRILVIEARTRIGGRVYARPCQIESDSELLEYGGSWITPWHERIRALCGELGLTLRPRTPIRERLALREGGPAPLVFDSEAERMAHQRALARIAADAMLLKAGLEQNEKGEPLTGLSYAHYMARLDPPPATRALQDAWWTVSGGAPMAEASAAEFLHSCAYDSGIAEDMINVWAHTVEPSMDTLAQRLIAASGATVVTDSPVASVAQSDTAVRVTLASGETHDASHVIVATGINPMQAITFSPPLRHLPEAAVTRGQRGRAFKLWIKARGVPVGRLITGDGTGVQLLFGERTAADDSTLLIGFGLHDEHAPLADAAWMRAQFARLCPNAEFLGYDWHDWPADPHARGTWVSTPYDLAHAFTAEAWAPQGRIAFASSDIAPENAGWFEGAVISGERAAEWVISRTPPPH